MTTVKHADKAEICFVVMGECPIFFSDFFLVFFWCCCCSVSCHSHKISFYKVFFFLVFSQYFFISIFLVCCKYFQVSQSVPHELSRTSLAQVCKNKIPLTVILPLLFCPPPSPYSPVSCHSPRSSVTHPSLLTDLLLFCMCRVPQGPWLCPCDHTVSMSQVLPTNTAKRR